MIRVSRFALFLALSFAMLLGVVLGIGVSLVAPGTLSADEPTDATFVETTEVRLVNLDVWVSNRDGEPVTGLQAEDFAVFEDGESVEVTHFVELRDGEPVEAAPSSAERSSDENPGVADAPERRPSPSVDPGHLVIYVDETHLAPASRKAVFDALRALLDPAAEGPDPRVPPHRVEILRQSQDLVKAAPFGSTAAELAATLDQLEERPSDAGGVERERLRLVTEIQRTWDDARQDPAGGDPCAITQRQARPLVYQLGLESAARVVTTLRHLWTTADVLAGLPGDKTLVYLGQGLEMAPGNAHLRFLDELCPDSASLEDPQMGIDLDLRERFRAFTRRANAARVTVYALDAGGLRAGPSLDVEMGAANLRSIGAYERVARRDLESGLNALADDTGGRAVFGRNRFDDALATIVRDMGTHYSLGYPPPTGAEERERTLEVRLKGDLEKDLRVRHRRGHRDLGADERLAAGLRTALFAGWVENRLDARFGWDAARLADAPGRYKLPLRVEIPANRLVFLPEGEIETARVTLLAAARDAAGEVVDFVERRLVVERPPEGITPTLRVEIEVPAGELVVGVAVRDDLGHATSVLAASLELGKSPRGAEAGKE